MCLCIYTHMCFRVFMLVETSALAYLNTFVWHFLICRFKEEEVEVRHFGAAPRMAYPGTPPREKRANARSVGPTCLNTIQNTD